MHPKGCLPMKKLHAGAKKLSLCEHCAHSKKDKFDNIFVTFCAQNSFLLYLLKLGFSSS